MPPVRVEGGRSRYLDGGLVGYRGDPGAGHRVAAPRHFRSTGYRQHPRCSGAVRESDDLPVHGRFHHGAGARTLGPAPAHRPRGRGQCRHGRAPPDRRIHAGLRRAQHVDDEHVDDDDAAADRDLRRRGHSRQRAGPHAEEPRRFPDCDSPGPGLFGEYRWPGDPDRDAAERAADGIHGRELRHRNQLRPLDDGRHPGQLLHATDRLVRAHAIPVSLRNSRQCGRAESPARAPRRDGHHEYRREASRRSVCRTDPVLDVSQARHGMARHYRESPMPVSS